MSRFLRYLRIAFSATCLIACVLLIVLWVRSYWWTYGVNANDGIQEFGISMERGELVAALGSVPKLSLVHFYWESQPVTQDSDMPGLMGFYCGAIHMEAVARCYCFRSGFSEFLLPQRV
jgi:hypothetical protein